MRKQLGFTSLFLLGLGITATVVAGCRRRAVPGDDTDQIGAAVGEVMASLDESTQGATATALLPAAPTVPILRLPAPLRGPTWRRALDAVFPSAYAASCWTSGFSGCASGVRTKTFDACTLGPATLDGDVTLTFTRTAVCAMVSDGDAVTRTADLLLTGPYGGTLEITSPGGGQTLTRTATGFLYSVGGMQRVLTGAGGRKLWDTSTHTTAPLVITGSGRGDLVIASGTLVVKHNLAGYEVALTPSNLTWTAGCNCATGGALTGTISGGRLDGKSATVELTGCGEAEVTIGDDVAMVTLDRCAAL
jgi:hypothetical protein